MSFFKNALLCLTGFRKFIIMFILIIVSIIFRVLNYVDGAQFVDLLKGAVIAFFTANIGEHVINLVKEKFKNAIK